MAPVTKNVKPQFSHVHPNHHLIHNTHDKANYACDACKTTGFGDRFRCVVCVIDIHEYCADCPTTHFSASLHNHPLPLITGDRMRICDVCRESIDAGAMFYGCQECGFHVHPLCTQLPDRLRHVIDDNHALSLKKLPYGSCGVSGMGCSSLWVYGCDICKLNVHLKCLCKPYGSQGSTTKLRGIPHGHGHGPPQFHGYGVEGSYNHYGYGYGGYGFPWGFPHDPYYYFHSGAAPQIAHSNNPSYHPNHSGNNGHGPSSSSSWGSMFGNTMFSLIGNVAAGAINGYLFGSSPF